MTDRELVQQALEALTVYDGTNGESKRKRVLAALRERLARQEQEPVAWMYQDKSTHEVRFQKHMREFVDHGATYETPLYTAPQREWVNLTDDEMHECWDSPLTPLGMKHVRAIEAKLKEKNA